MNFKLKPNSKVARGSKLSKCRKDNSDCIPMETPILRDDPPEEDQRLVNWKRWLANRESRQQHLTKALRREPLDLRLNAHERVRARNETRCFLQAAVRPEITHQDRYRGNPAFWKSPYKLKKDPNDAVTATMSLEDECLPPRVTRVGLPQLIRKEKMLVKSCVDQTKIDLTSKWECGDYLQKRTADLKHELKAMEHKKPDMDDLIIMGKNFSCGDQECLRTPVITITTCETKKKLLSHPEERIALKIQDREFVLERGHHFEKMSHKRTEELRESKEDQKEELYAYSVFESDRVYKILPKKCKSITWTLNFETDQNESCIRYLVLENRGVRALSVDWRNASPTSARLPLPERFESRFFFNKNPLSILPGQKLEIPIGYSSEKPAFFTETWKLLIEPKIHPSSLYLRFYATSSGEFWKSREIRHQTCIRDYVAHRVRESIVRDIVEDIFLEATNEKPVEVVPYHLFFLEPEVFEVRNPTYFHYSTLVNELKDMYQEVTEATDEEEEEEHEEVPPWNLSLKELRWRLLKIPDPVLRCHKLVRFQEICDQCLRPNRTYSPPSFSKERLVYWILCTFFNQFEVESDFVMRKCCYEGKEVNANEEDNRSNVNNSEAGEGESEELVCNDPKMYREVYRIRIYTMLCDTIGKICAAVDSHNFLNGDRLN